MAKTGSGKTDRRIRVLCVAESFDVGGTERQCYELAAHLDPARFAVGVVTPNAAGPLRARFEALGCPIHEVAFPGGYWRPGALRSLGRLVRVMRAFKADIVQTFGFYSNVPGIPAARLAGVRGVIASRRFTMPEDPALNHHLSPLKDRVDRLLWRFADCVVVNARVIGSQVAAKGVAPEKVCVIHNGVDYEAVAAAGEAGGIASEDGGAAGVEPRDAGPAGAELVGMVANFRPDKDHRTFLQAARYVRRYRPRTRFLLVGSGPLEASMRAYAGELGLADAVAFLGPRYGAELYRLLRRCAVLALCSVGNEGLPNVLLEAMAAGKPVVTTRVGGAPEVVQDGVTGFVVDRGDAKAVGDRILSLMERPTLARAMGVAGRARVRQSFTIERMAARFASLYRRILNGGI